MAMRLISEDLLENEIEKYEQKKDLESHEKLILSLCKKELPVIRKLKIYGIDMTGRAEDVKDRIDNQSIFFMDSLDFQEMQEKARRYDQICDLIKKNEPRLKEEIN